MHSYLRTLSRLTGAAITNVAALDDRGFRGEVLLVLATFGQLPLLAAVWHLFPEDIRDSYLRGIEVASLEGISIRDYFTEVKKTEEVVVPLRHTA